MPSLFALTLSIGALATIPAPFYDLASNDGLILSKGGPALDAALLTILSVVVGTAYYFLSAKLNGAMTKA